MRRALAFRFALVLIMPAVVIARGFTPTPSTWPIFIGFFLVFGTVAVTLFTAGDQRLAVRAGHATPPWTGPNARWAQFAYRVPFHEAMALAKAAVTQVGAENVETVNDLMVTGWVGPALTNLPQGQQYQVAVALFAAPDGTTVFTSCARPRWSSAMFGASKSQQLATLLQNQLWFLIHRVDRRTELSGVTSAL